MRRFRKLNARRQIDPPPAPAVRPPRPLIPPPGGGGLIQASRPMRAAGGGRAKDGKGGGNGTRSVVIVHILVVAPSHRRCLIPLPVVVSSSHPPHFHSVRRFLLLVAIRCRLAPRLVHRSVVSSSYPFHSSSHPRRRLIRRRLAASCAVSLARRSSSCPVVPLSSRSIPSARSFSPFLDTMGGAFSHSIARRVSKHEGVAGRGIAMGVASMR